MVTALDKALDPSRTTSDRLAWASAWGEIGRAGPGFARWLQVYVRREFAAEVFYPGCPRGLNEVLEYLTPRDVEMLALGWRSAPRRGGATL